MTISKQGFIQMQLTQALCVCVEGWGGEVRALSGRFWGLALEVASSYWDNKVGSKGIYTPSRPDPVGQGREGASNP